MLFSSSSSSFLIAVRLINKGEKKRIRHLLTMQLQMNHDDGCSRKLVPSRRRVLICNRILPFMRD